MDLSDSEIRVLACLLEKQRTTPDHYPLSLNSLRLACNQTTNREPVVGYDDAVIRDALHRLERRGYTRLASGRGSRTAKYRHLLSEALPMADSEQAVMCVLMLRGPQTPGELKQRSERIHAFATIDGVHQTLAVLIERGLVAQLHRRPGQKEERYAQQLGEGAPSSSGVGVFTSRHVVGEGIASTAAPPARDAGLPDRAGLPGRGELAARGGRAEQGGLSGRAGLSESAASTSAASESAVLSERMTRLEGEVAQLRAALAELREQATTARAASSGHNSHDEPHEPHEPHEPDESHQPDESHESHGSHESAGSHESDGSEESHGSPESDEPREPQGTAASWGEGLAQPTP
jgi:uncharacterized protein YceH (UPF0502 family)